MRSELTINVQFIDPVFLSLKILKIYYKEAQMLS